MDFNNSKIEKIKSENNNPDVFEHFYDMLFDASGYHIDKHSTKVYNRWFVNFSDKEKFILSVHKLNSIMYASECDWIILSPENYKIIEYIKNAKNYYKNIGSLHNDPIENMADLLSGKTKTSFRASDKSSDNIEMTCLSSGFFEINELTNGKLKLFENKFIFPNIKNEQDLEKHIVIFKEYINSVIINTNTDKEVYLKTMADFFAQKSKFAQRPDLMKKFLNLKKKIFAKPINISNSIIK